MKVFVIGSNGQLGQELQKTAPENIELIALTRQQLDITNYQQVEKVISAQQPDLIINAAAYTKVDKAEEEIEQAYAVNEKGTANIAMIAKRIGVPLIHISTDFVFDGQSSRPYLPTDNTNPLSVYGASKLAGEQKIIEIFGDKCVAQDSTFKDENDRNNSRALIIRTSWLYSSYNHNFVKTMLRLLQERDQLNIVGDQVGTPTWSRNLARLVWSAAVKPTLSGIYHFSDAGVASWYDFACAIQNIALSYGLLSERTSICPINTEQFPLPAKRPHYSVLDKQQTWKDFEFPPQHWHDALKGMLLEVKI